jgi:hypothetical protein
VKVLPYLVAEQSECRLARALVIQKVRNDPKVGKSNERDREDKAEDEAQEDASGSADPGGNNAQRDGGGAGVEQCATKVRTSIENLAAAAHRDGRASGKLNDQRQPSERDARDRRLHLPRQAQRPCGIGGRPTGQKGRFYYAQHCRQ